MSRQCRNYHVFGTGYATMTKILETPANAFAVLLPLLAVLVIAKPIATPSHRIGRRRRNVLREPLPGALWGGLVGVTGHALPPPS